MIRPTTLLIFIAVTGTSAIFFGGGSSCCSSCCPAPNPCCGSRKSLFYFPWCGNNFHSLACGGGASYASAPQIPQESYAPAPIPQQSYAVAPPPQAYPQPVSIPCRPRYIIVRQVEQQFQAPVQQQYVQPAQAPIPPVPQENAPVEQPIETGPISNPQEAGYKAFASKTVSDPKCNSAELRILIENEITGDSNESKRRVHKAANEQFQTTDSERGIDVICANGTFSYRIATDIFCEHTKGDITCFAYQQHS